MGDFYFDAMPFIDSLGQYRDAYKIYPSLALDGSYTDPEHTEESQDIAGKILCI